MWSPNEGVKDELKIFLTKFVERSVATVIGAGLVATAVKLGTFAMVDPEPTSMMKLLCIVLYFQLSIITPFI